jgi:hypothetical protein
VAFLLPQSGRKDNQMNLADFFDPNNIEHIRAYRHLENTGSWPKSFLNNLNFNIEIAYLDIPAISAKIANHSTSCELKTQLRDLIADWCNDANGHYCQTYNKGMAVGLLQAADDLQTLIGDLEA